MHSKILPFALLLAGCAAEPLVFEGLPCEQPARSGDDLSYSSDQMGCVEITMDPQAFQALSQQYRFDGDEEEQWPAIIAATALSCSEPYPSRYTYFSADIDVDGWQAQNVGVRKKGFIGSTVGAEDRPSLKVKTDEFVNDQQFGDTERATYNNNHQDASRTRTCLTYSVFEDAGYPAPRCNLANVSMNGQPLGAYSHVESIKKRFLRRNFGNDDGSLYEGTMADFTEAHLAGLPENLGRFEAKTGDTDPTGAGLRRITDALQVPDDELEQALDEVIDLDAFLMFWALETLVNHNDGYNANHNNFYVYFDPDSEDRAVFIPWGADQTMYDWDRRKVTSELARRVSRVPELHQRYLETLAFVLEDVWSEERLSERIDRYEAQVLSAETGPSYRKESVEGLRSWVVERRAAMQSFIAEGGEVGAAETGPCTGDTDPNDFLMAAELTSATGAACSTTGGGPTMAFSSVLLLLVRRRRA